MATLVLSNSATEQHTPYTPQDVIDREEKGLYELVGGQLVEKTISSVTSETTGLITARLVNFARPAKAGDVYVEQTFQCFPDDPDEIRRPDVAFIATERLAGVAPEGPIKIAPDLAVEVISPNDKVYDLEEKLADYRSAGIKLVWVVNPRHRWIHIHRLGQPVKELWEADRLEGDLAPAGFAIEVRELLPEAAPKRV